MINLNLNDALAQLYGYVPVFLIGLVFGFIAGSWLGSSNEDDRVALITKQLEECVARSADRSISDMVRCKTSCEENERGACDRRVEALRKSFIDMRCELCK